VTPAVLEADRVFGALVSAWLDAGEPAETDLGTLSSEAGAASRPAAGPGPVACGVPVRAEVAGELP